LALSSAASAVRVVGLCGSLREVSYTRFAVHLALLGAEEVGAQSQLIDLRQYDLPLCDGRRDQDTYPKDVARLRGDVEAAQGIVLGTPVYHGSFSGVLKNALDLMGFRELEGKMIGLGRIWGVRAGIRSTNCAPSAGRCTHGSSRKRYRSQK
jgi:FMN reductase